MKVFDGHLRYAGDGYEWAELYLDNASLVSSLVEALSHTDYERHHWVVDPLDAEEHGTTPWRPVDKEAMREAWRADRDNAPYIATLALRRDFGRVRITIERMDDDETT